MLSQPQIKLIRSLHLKKFREEEQLSLAEGHKIVLDLLQNKLKVKALICTPKWLQENKKQLPPDLEIWEAKDQQMERISLHKSPAEVMLIMRTETPGPAPIPGENELFLFLDEIRDPGNLGTIIRTCDWFGIRNLVVSETTVETTSPKTIQAAMGSFGRIKIYREPAGDYLKKCHEAGVVIAGAFMEGTNIREMSGQKPGLLIIGNEGQGISQQLTPFINKKISIPGGKAAPGLPAAESLNASIAAAILIFSFSRH